jgi:formylglycine-generating enzyme required for sulfatase activity
LSRDYFLYDADGQGTLDELQLPIRVGGSKHGGIVIPGLADEQQVAIIALDDGHAFIQPTGIAVSVFHNDERLLDSVWLKSGDRVQITDQILSWEVQGDRVMISVQAQQPEIHQLRPPKHAPEQGAPPEDTLPVAEHDLVNRYGKGLRRRVIAVVGFLLLAAIYLLTVTSVNIKVEPAAAEVKLRGFPPAVSIRGSRLALPGNYRLEISAAGYVPLSTELDIDMGPPLVFTYTLAELPGLILLNTTPQSELTLYVDEIETAANMQGQYELERGPHSLRLENRRYLPVSTELEVEGFGAEQVIDIELQPAWAVVSVATTPGNADVLVDGVIVAQTPSDIEILQGRREIGFELTGFKPISFIRTVAAGEDFNIQDIQLEPVNGTITIGSQPTGANVLVGSKFLGTTPLTLELASETGHQLQLSKNGYVTADQVFKLAPDEKRALNISLEAEYGVVYLSVKPAGASLTINGKQSDRDSGRLRLQTISNTLKLSKPGYVSQTINVTPRPGVSQNINLSLVTEAQQQVQIQEAATPSLLSIPGGQTLELIKPDSNFNMGASRSGAGRRANESQRLVKLKRAFYLGHKEVTNAQFQRFKPKHDSGRLDSAALNGKDQPVVNVSWDDAARYSNWLSKQQGLEAAYREENGQMLAVSPMTTGYRLPSEAEWAWVARRFNSETSQRYPWQGSFPPATQSGNYADAQIADTLTDVVPNYNDKFRGSAPVGSFPAWPASTHGGFYDLGGNVSEWIHDYYAVYPGEAKHLVTDPMGPETGNHHVVRGASWRDGNITELRLSYRDYSNKPHYDLGFRIARYAE